MKQSKHTRRFFNLVAFAGVVALAGAGGIVAAQAQQKAVKVGITLPLTGADADDAGKIQHGFQIAIDEANAKGGVGGYKIEVVTYDSGTATAGQYDPAQAATNTKKLISDPMIVANLGPEMSGEGKAMTPILSEADLATITPSSTNPDITSPAMAAQFKPKGRAIYFRTVTTDAFQGAFQKRAEANGIKILGRDQLNPKEADYTTILTKIKGLNPDALYYGGVAQAGVKLAKQAYDVIPKMPKGGGDGIQGGSFFTGVGFPAVEGWYSTNAGPHLTEDPAAVAFVKTFTEKYKTQPTDYSITAYDAALVVLDAIKRVAESGKPVTRTSVRDAIQTTNLKTLQGEISFDENGDIKDHTVSVFQYKRDAKYPADDYTHQNAYIGTAPQS